LKIGNAFDVVANLVANSRVDNGIGGYQASLNLTVVNHKDIDVKIEILFNNNHGDNLRIRWD